MTFWVGLLVGLLAGWLVEWALDWFVWRRTLHRWRERYLRAEAEKNQLLAQLAEARDGRPQPSEQ